MTEKAGVISSIEPQKKQKNRFNIFIDGEFAFGADRDVLLDNPLHEGDTVSDAQIAALKNEDEAVRARVKALALISYRMRSVQEIEERLLKSGYGPAAVSRVTADLCRIGVLDDYTFTEAYIHTRLIQRPAARKVLALELKRKGVAESIITALMEQMYSDSRERLIARQLAEKKSKSLPAERQKAARRLSDYLLRRGFSWDTVMPLLDEFTPNEEQE